MCSLLNGQLQWDQQLFAWQSKFRDRHSPSYDMLIIINKHLSKSEWHAGQTVWPKKWGNNIYPKKILSEKVIFTSWLVKLVKRMVSTVALKGAS